VQKIRLGRTGLEVSVAGLGCGGHSRLGLATGHDESHAVRVVETALDLGIDFIDTARAYRTESVVGKAISGRRDRVVISTKVSPARGGQLLSVEGLRESLEKSLARLGTDYVDIFHLHGVRASSYEHCKRELVPELLRLREAGKIRFLGITEQFGGDTGHEMFSRALPDDLFDVIMVGFNLLNPSARQRVFPLTRERDVGTLIMFAVRRALSQPNVLVEILEQLVAAGKLRAAAIDSSDPLGFLTAHPNVESVVQAAYRFCRHEPGAHVVLTGTGSVAHLESNVRAITAPPLPQELSERLRDLFGSIDSISAN